MFDKWLVVDIYASVCSLGNYSSYFRCRGVTTGIYSEPEPTAEPCHTYDGPFDTARVKFIYFIGSPNSSTPVLFGCNRLLHLSVTTPSLHSVLRVTCLLCHWLFELSVIRALPRDWFPPDAVSHYFLVVPVSLSSRSSRGGRRNCPSRV